MPYLPFVEVIALPHLDAVKDMVTSIDHSFAIFIYKWTAWVYHYADASKQKGRVKKAGHWYQPPFTTTIVRKITSLSVDTTGVPSKSSREPLRWGSEIHFHIFVSGLVVVVVMYICYS